MSPVEYFLKGIYNTIKLILSVHEQLVFIFLTCLVQDKINVKFLLASLKTLTNFKHCYSESRIKFVFRLSFALIGRFFPVFINSRLSEPFSGSRQVSEQLLETQAANRTPEHDVGRKLLEGISLFVSDFIETSRNFNLDFLHKKTTKNGKNDKCSIKKYC
jgi:hypothetical protein